MKKIARYLWQLPQHLLAGLLLLLLRRRIERRRDSGENRVYYVFTRYGGISLGAYLLVHREADDLLLRHELGHCRQSLMLGPLYLLVIGLPSLLWAGLYPLAGRLRPGISYFDFYTERWANSLSGLRVVEPPNEP